MSNKILGNLMYVYDISFYASIASNVLLFLSKKLSALKYFYEVFDIYITILVKKYADRSAGTLVIQI